MSNKIPTPLFLCATLTATACGKSNEKIAEDICANITCEFSSDESYADYVAEFTEECITDGISELESMAEDDCASQSKKFSICISNLTCTQFGNMMQGEDHDCKTEEDELASCQEG